FQIPTNLSERPTLADVGLAFAPRAASIYQGSFASARVQVLQGATLTLDAQRVARGLVAATGSLVDDEGHPIAAAPVVLRAAGLDLGEARTARNGSFLLERPLPAAIGLGDITALASFPGETGVAPANATATWAVRSPLALEITQMAPLVRGETAPIAGTLVDDQGQPVDATLDLTLAGRPVGSLAAHAGKLAGGIAVPADLARGDATLWLNATATGKYD